MITKKKKKMYPIQYKARKEWQIDENPRKSDVTRVPKLRACIVFTSSLLFTNREHRFDRRVFLEVLMAFQKIFH